MPDHIINEAKTDFTPVKIPDWQLCQIMKSVDDYLQHEYQAEELKLRDRIKELFEENQRLINRENKLIFENGQLKGQVLELEARIGRIAMERGIVK